MGDTHTSIKINKQLFKTKLCRNFKTNGSCRYGNLCQFAHGTQDTKHRAKSNKYKTKKCINFFSSGICYYGETCQFSHCSKKHILEKLRLDDSPHLKTSRRLKTFLTLSIY